MRTFLSYLSKANPSMYRSLAGKSVGSTSFNNSWKALASNDPTGFDKVQHDFIQQSHYDPVVSKVKSGIGLNLNTRSAALQNVVWSMGVQHGSGGAYKLFRNAGIRPSMSDQEIINRLYNERMKVDKYFSRSSSSIKASVKRRFQSELKDALAMLGTTSNTKMGRLST